LAIAGKGGIDFDISGVMAGLERKFLQIEAAAKHEMGECMGDLLAESSEIAPLDKGVLRGSAWQDVSSDNGTITGSVSYWAEEKDGARFNYALKVHEMGEYKNPTTPGTRPKFLSEPMKKNADTYKQRIADAISKAVKNG